MRLIGHLTSESNAATFTDFLYVQGISSEVEREKDGWAIWVHSEDELAQARDWFDGFRGNPQDPRFVERAAQARDLRKRDEATVEQANRRFFERSRVFRHASATGVGQLTLVLVLICLGVTGLAWAGFEDKVYEWLFMVKMVPEGEMIRFVPRLQEIRNGELWRLFTPVLVHLSVTHLVFNMMALYYLGNLIESQLGLWRFALLIVPLALISNLAQYIASGPNFCGFSGVVYGLLGYAWMRGRLEPQSGLEIHPQTVVIMLIWFGLCLTGWLGSIANTAHGAGLIVGTAWGFIEAKFNQRHRAT